MDEELKKAREDLKKNPPLSKEDYRKALIWLEKRVGKDGVVDFMKATELKDDKSEMGKMLRSLKELENKGIKLCEDCETKIIESFFKN